MAGKGPVRGAVIEAGSLGAARGAVSAYKAMCAKEAIFAAIITGLGNVVLGTVDGVLARGLSPGWACNA